MELYLSKNRNGGAKSMSDNNDLTVLEKDRPLTKEELSVELTPDNSQEEFAAEIAPATTNVIPLNRKQESVAEDKDAEKVNRSGWTVTGLLLSVFSLFFLPVLLASAGILLGYLGYRRGERTLGFWAMGLGAISLLGTLIVSVMV